MINNNHLLYIIQKAISQNSYLIDRVLFEVEFSQDNLKSAHQLVYRMCSKLEANIMQSMKNKLPNYQYVLSLSEERPVTTQDSNSEYIYITAVHGVQNLMRASLYSAISISYVVNDKVCFSYIFHAGTQLSIYGGIDMNVMINQKKALINTYINQDNYQALVVVDQNSINKVKNSKDIILSIASVPLLEAIDVILGRKEVLYISKLKYSSIVALLALIDDKYINCKYEHQGDYIENFIIYKKGFDPTSVLDI